jgi:hypothetical protein
MRLKNDEEWWGREARFIQAVKQPDHKFNGSWDTFREYVGMQLRVCAQDMGEDHPHTTTIRKRLEEIHDR